jgi:pimeloyl-ACP methyl ester carboxylesterase
MKHSTASPIHRTTRERTLDALPVTERRLSLNGVSTAVLEGGDGPPMLLLHGPSGYAAHWREVIPELVMTNRVIVPDLPGHGASEPFAGVPSPDAVLGWIDDLIECTCPAPPIVVGQALGGALAARFAAERRLRLRALVLVDSLGLSAFQPTPEFGAALHEFLAAPGEQTHDRLWNQCAFDLPRLQRRLGRHWASLKAYNLDCALAPGRLAAVSSLMEQFGISAIPTTMLARIGVPTALIWGREDRATPLRVASDASARFGWQLRVIDGAADDPSIEQPQSFVAELRALIGQLPHQARLS